MASGEFAGADGAPPPGDALAAAASAFLRELEAAHRLRTLRPLRDAAGTIDLTHNDYLGLRDDLELRGRALDAARAWPAGAGASRLLGGEHTLYAALEAQFAHFVGFASALYLSSGYAANEAALGALSRLPDVAFFSDALNHASLIDGLRLSGLPRERRQVFAHNDIDDLRQRLAASDAALRVVVTESVFSMDGDVAPLRELGRACDELGATLFVDEAHAVYCLDAAGGAAGAAWADAWRGRGLAHQSGLSADKLISVYPCGKALAAQGAFVCGPPWLRALLINTARPFIFSTGASPWLAAALQETLAYTDKLHAKRARLATIAAHVRTALQSRDYDTGASTTHIIPVMIGDDAAALACSARLEELGILARAIRPPTVAPGSCRLRLSLSAGHSDSDVERVIAAFRKLRA